MDDVKIARITGVCGLACVALTFGQFPDDRAATTERSVA